MATSRFEERNLVIKRFNSQFAHPEGWAGRFVGMILALKNRERNAWTISMLDIQPSDQVLEIGFGPGQAIQEVAKLTQNGFVAGIDLSDVMVAQASKRNSVAIRSGRVLLQQGAESPLVLKMTNSQSLCGQLPAVLVKPNWGSAGSESKTWRSVVITIRLCKRPKKKYRA
jgi:SAM-dependent methyltransferase